MTTPDEEVPAFKPRDLILNNLIPTFNSYRTENWEKILPSLAKPNPVIETPSFSEMLNALQNEKEIELAFYSNLRKSGIVGKDGAWNQPDDYWKTYTLGEKEGNHAVIMKLTNHVVNQKFYVDQLDRLSVNSNLFEATLKRRGWAGSGYYEHRSDSYSKLYYDEKGVLMLAGVVKNDR